MSIVKQIQSVAKALCDNYTLKGAPVPVEKVFNETALLPAIMRRADQLASFCLGYNLGLTFKKAEGSMLQVKVEFNDSVSSALRLLCVTDVLVEIIQAAPNPEAVSLDGLLLEK